MGFREIEEEKYWTGSPKMETRFESEIVVNDCGGSEPRGALGGVCSLLCVLNPYQGGRQAEKEIRFVPWYE